MSTVTDRVLITEPGVYDMTADAYHADPVDGGSLSSSGARALLPPSCPARYRYDRDHGQARRRTFDLGHAAHLLVLGEGPELVVIEADSYRTGAAKQQRDEAHERGAVPLLADEAAQVVAMASALRLHPVASVLFDPDSGVPEQTLIWRDDPTGMMRRARLDWLPEQPPHGRLIIPDYKTCHSAAPDLLARAAYQYGYHQQADWNIAGARALGLAHSDAAFVFVCQEKAPPYLVTVLELDATALRIGAILNRRALQVYGRCVETGTWPAYVEGVAHVALPRWAEVEEGEHLQ